MARFQATNRFSIRDYKTTLRFTAGTNVVNNSLTISSQFNISSSDFTMFGVFYADSFVDNSSRIMLWSQTATQGLFGMADAGMCRRFGIDNGAGLKHFSASAPQCSWVHFALTFNATTKNWNLYLNGILDPTTVNANPPNAAQTHIIGHHYSTTSWGFSGRMCGNYLLKRICTPGEAEDFWRTGGLPIGIYEWKAGMTESTGNPVDSSGNGYTITKGSAVTWTNTILPSKARVNSSRRIVLRDYSKSISSLTTSGYGTAAPTSLINNIFSGGGAIGFWVKPRDVQVSAQTFMAKNVGSVGWSCRLAASAVPRLTVSFTTTNGEFRLFNTGLKLGQWNFLFVWYNSDSAANVPVSYHANPLNQIFTKPTITVTTAPVGSYKDDSTSALLFSFTSNSIVGPVYFFKGVEPTQTSVENLFWDGKKIPSMTFLDRWRKGSVNFESDSGINDASLVGSATLSDDVPLQLRDMVI